MVNRLLDYLLLLVLVLAIVVVTTPLTVPGYHCQPYPEVVGTFG